MSGGTIFKGSRALRWRERLYLLRRWTLFRAGQFLAAGSLSGFGVYAVATEDQGLQFLTAVLAIPALWAVWRLQRALRPFERDLFDNRVESTIGAIGGLDLTRGLVPMRLGEDVYSVQSELLRRKHDGEPIMVETLKNTHLAVAIDGKSNLMSWRRWIELGGREIG